VTNLFRPKPRWDILSVGDATLDIFLALNQVTTDCRLDTKQCELCISYADKVPIESIHRVVGGNAANNAVGSSRLGLKSAFFGVTGDDEISHMIKNNFVKEKVDSSLLTMTKGKVANTSVILWYKFERTILIYHEPRTYHWPSNLPAARYLYFTSMRKGFEKFHPQILKYIEKTKTKLVFQPGTFQLALGLKKLLPLIKASEFFVLNREEAAGLLGKPGSTSVPQLMHELGKYAPNKISITDGQNGAWGCDFSDVAAQRFYYVPLFPGDRIEATGAGDAFATAVTAALAVGKPFAEALLWGPVNSASVIQKIGPQAGLLNRSEIEGRLRKAPRNYRVKASAH
jgi:sugar/nucleoside kinase (ribokinase family)